MIERDIKDMAKLEYKPFSKAVGFSTYSTPEGEVCFVTFEEPLSNRNYLLEIQPGGGFVPKSGLIVSRCIEDVVRGKRGLDMCTGETGILAIHSAISGASEVVGVDVDEKTVAWAKYNGQLNSLGNTKWVVSDLFKDLGEEKFDVIISNPPQMPMASGPTHDWGGTNGRDFIERIISDAPSHLSPKGELYILIFDFLGVTESYGDIPPLKEIFKKHGFQIEIVAKEKRKVRKGGQTEKSLEYIQKEYPYYRFQTEDDSLFHEILIVRAILSS